MNLKSLSLKQPWAQCIFHDGKNVENRVWSTKYRGWVAIHASRTRARSEFELCKSKYGRTYDSKEVPRGAILGFVKLTEVITKSEVTKPTKKWFEGDYGFVLSEIISLKSPVGAKGSLGLRDLDKAVFRQCLKQMSDADLKRLQKPV